MIRPATLNDLEEILAIYNDAIVNTTAVYSYHAQTLEDRKAWFEQKQADGYPVIVFEIEGHVAGFATFGPFRAWPAYKYSIEHSVYVNTDYRKQGIGRKLLQAIIDLAKAGEYKTLVAGIDAANDKSIWLHEKLGFTHSGTVRNAGYKFERWLDLAFYQLDLDGPEIPQEG
ncbi:N-acetyltransferase [Chryseomicrobium excrementi]|uniref:N-acetyltransferase n=1 Tax=Chryseomicrobium excrementi TaxID=2041346 RepID=A0A2M9EY33_9BACL|nr:GNAT family N-acetyltransferase [Chryseomicrobium excrementi]PJK16119.1 N-acetyltransferase [Chryseomicrobium excrementi]